MAQGKYSPTTKNDENEKFEMNAKGCTPVNQKTGPWNPETMLSGFNDKGYDRYGYSCYDSNGAYVGDGNGIDSLGYTEDDYMLMDSEAFQDIQFSI